MHIPPRILRKHALDVQPSLRHLDEKEYVREEMILKIATTLIARFGAGAITFTNLATAIKISPTTMRRHFTDLDALIGELMRRHLKTISQAIGAIPHDAPDRLRRQRQAYIGATRPYGAPTEAHLILTTCRSGLAEDERSTIEDIRAVIGRMLGPENPEGTLYLLDCPCFDITQIEAMLAAAHPAEAAPEPEAEILPPETTESEQPHVNGVKYPLWPVTRKPPARPWQPPKRLLIGKAGSGEVEESEVLLFEKRSKNFGEAVADSNTGPPAAKPH